MMNTVTVYEAATGRPLRTLRSNDASFVDLNTSEGEAVYWGELDPSLQYVTEDLEVSTIPVAPSPWSVWDWGTKSWVDNTPWPESAWADLREKRNRLLVYTDRFVAQDFPHKTPEALPLWKSYRTALRELPANTENPLLVVWPEPPEPL